MIVESNSALLTPPVSERDYVRGPAEAPVVLVEYGDYECPFCGKAHAVVKLLAEEIGDQFRYVFRHFPLATMHPHAQRAAEAAEAAAAQGRFWKMHDTLFENQHALDDRSLALYAARIGLDVPRFIQDMAEHKYAGRVREHFMSGVHSGVNGTPSFFVNGVRHDDSWDARTLGAAILEAAASEE